MRVYSSNSGKLTYTLRNNDLHPLPVTCVRWRPASTQHKTKNILIAGNSDGSVKHWHVTSEKCVHTINEEGNQIYAVDYRNDAEQFATGGKDYHVRVYDEKTKQLVVVLSGGLSDASAGHANRVFSIKFHPRDPNVLLSGGWDNTVQIWDIRSGHSERSIYGPHICGDALDIDANDVILTGSWRPENPLQLWDYGSGALIENLPWKQEPEREPTLLYTAQFSKGTDAGSLVAAGGTGSNDARIFSRSTNSLFGEITGFRKGIYTIDFSSDSKMLAVGGASSLMFYATS